MTEQVVSPSTDNAGVRVPPPLIYGVLFGLSQLLQRFVPLPSFSSALTSVAALLFLLAGIILIVWSNALFQRAHTSLVPIRPSTTLVIQGVFRLTRNPMYLGLLCIYIAAALWFGALWALILAPVLLLIMQRMVIVKEERYLERRFGDAYRQYCTQVRRWI